MADSSDQAAAPQSGNKVTRWIKKNKTLSAVLGAGGLYFLLKKSHGSEEGEAATVEEGVTPVGLSGPLPASEYSREGINEEINRIDEENREEREERERFERETENQNNENPNAPADESEGNEGRGAAEEGTGAESHEKNGINIHGKFFANATDSRIANTGTSEGGKHWIEYVITFPGRQEHWRYWPASGNWSQVKDSKGAPKPPTPVPPGQGGGGGGGKGPVPAGTKNPRHPNAVSTGNACVNGGVGPHVAPPGYHLFCENGTIWRAPDNVGIGPGKPVGGTPPPAPAPSGGIDGHPNAVKTANKCVNGGIGKHTPPPGWHLFCASDGWIWRAPNGG